MHVGTRSATPRCAARAGQIPEAYRWIKRANLGLVEVDPELAGELEAGKSQCALAG